MKKIIEIIKKNLLFIILIILIILIKNYIVTPVRVSGDSMYDTLYNRDIMFLNRIAYLNKDIQRGDIIVINYNKTKLIKRVIGLPGEAIKAEDNKIYINDLELEEVYLNSEVLNPDFNTFYLDNNQYFVIGDNRTSSVDSRVFGAISKDDILGKARFTFFPLNRIGLKE